MTPQSLLDAMLPLVADLARQIPPSERYRRLLDAVRRLLPADCAALLRLDGDALVPLAVDGLSADTLGRRFRVDQHPRLQALLAAEGPLRFAPDCGLPDPYDGLVEHHHGHLPVHDCMGCALRVQDRPWGLLTLDALVLSRFDAVDMAALQSLADLAAATVAAAERMDDLALRAEDAQHRAEQYRRAAGQERPRARRLVGRSAAHRALLREVALVGPSALTVLVSGETGTGKELVTQALHAASPRAGRALVSLNCAALPESLVESELFGHVRGAFSGAVAERQGKFELADGGTLFLDEVGELPLAVQAKLLRVLQNGQLQRLGSDREHRVDVRLIAATNRDLAAEVRAGRFRADLYHRLGAYPLHLPPLRERGRDVLLLAGAFLEEQRATLGLGNLRLAADAQQALLAHAWPGNVRELEHVLARAALRALARHAQRPRVLTLDANDLGLGAAALPVATAPMAQAAAVPAQPLRLRVQAFERQAIEAALASQHGNWAAAARSLDMDRANLVRLARRVGLAVPARNGRPGLGIRPSGAQP
ncbi:nitric oxide reductase transcriptional regulator NorR [Pseudorhodoferax sp.]|uniref:nitric oxide reductase transcriptional regulator NorR n=1 Tax=Pseudorhodoferax sp. TaxID=1993553 RepID=UPI002DD681F4|nr:nitric oxide reductase transcriptional regulator NorR [Pseudorhodoferax sp.]